MSTNNSGFQDRSHVLPVHHFVETSVEQFSPEDVGHEFRRRLIHAGLGFKINDCDPRGNGQALNTRKPQENKAHADVFGTGRGAQARSPNQTISAPSFETFAFLQKLLSAVIRGIPSSADAAR